MHHPLRKGPQDALDPLDAGEDASKGFFMLSTFVFPSAGGCGPFLLRERRERPLCIDLSTREPIVRPEVWQQGRTLSLQALGCSWLVCQEKDVLSFYRVLGPHAAPMLLKSWPLPRSGRHYERMFLSQGRLHLYQSFGVPLPDEIRAWISTDLDGGDARVVISRWPRDLRSSQPMLADSHLYGMVLVQRMQGLAYQVILSPPESWPRLQDVLEIAASQPDGRP